MSGETAATMPEMEENAGLNMNFRLLLLLGLSGYIAVTIVGRLFQPGIQGFSDEQWLGTDADRLVQVYGPATEVEEDGRGGSILKYRRVQVIDHHYSVERFDVFVDPSGNVSDIKREPTGE